MARHKKKPVSLAGPKVHLATIQNPDWRADLDGEKAFPRDIVAAVNMKESSVETLFARKLLSKSQKQAADKFREHWEKAGGKSSGLDYTQDRVDGGRGDPVTSKLASIQELKRARQYLGMRGYETLEAICGEGKSMTDLAPHKRERLTMADNLRADLDDLATMWGMQTKQRQVKEARQHQRA
jgi:hypothetical protein